MGEQLVDTAVSVIISVECQGQYYEGNGKYVETCKKKRYLDVATIF